MHNDDAQPSVLDRLYSELAGADQAESALADQHQQALEQIETEQQRLQDKRRDSEAAGDTARLQEIDSDLDELHRAYLTIKDQLGEDQQQDRRRRPDQRGSDGDAPGAGD